MTDPLVTVVIPTRRRPGLVIRALRSVLAQTHAALDVVVVIDGPDPETVHALDTWLDDRVRVTQTEIASGAGAARNFAAATARGAWIAFLDDDDEWLPDKIARQLAAAGGRDVLVTCRSLVRTPAGEELWPRTLYESPLPVDEYLFDRRTPFRGDAHVGTSTFLMPTALFARTQFSTDRQNEDTTLLLRVTKQAGAAVVMVPDALVVLYKEEARESLGGRFDWREMLGWVDGMGELVTRRAYSGFCLIYLGSQAARRGDLRALPVLLGRAFARGSPRPMHLLPFLAFWVLPPGLRRRLRLSLTRRAAC
jgi:glycosyltransferase involved in cell wall biosynthesis